MVKKATSDKNTSQDIDERSHKMAEFNSVCKLKHEVIDKEFENIKTDADRRHGEIKDLIKNLQKGIEDNVKESNENLKDKIVLTEKTIGDKIDKLNQFDDTLKGNGTPGVWESIRSLKWKFGVMITLLSAIIILFVGGNVKGVTWVKIKSVFGFSNTETKQVELIKSQTHIIKKLEKDK